MSFNKAAESPIEEHGAGAMLDGTRLRPAHVLCLAICCLAMMVDAFQVIFVGGAVPALAQAYGVSVVEVTPVIVISQVGMLVGAYLITPLADRWGRRRMLIFSFIFITATSVGVWTAGNLLQLTIWRTLGGMFTAAVIPNILSLVSEIAPVRYRSRFGAITYTGSFLGLLLISVMQAYVLEPYGWNGAVILSIILSAVTTLLVIMLLPESPRFLLLKSPGDPRLAKLLKAFGGAFKPSFLVPPSQQQGASENDSQGIKGIFKRGTRGWTLLLWSVFAVNYISFTLWFNWSTVVFHEMLELSYSTIALIGLLYTIASYVGALSMGVVMDRFGPKQVLPAALFISFLGAAGLAFTVPTFPMYIFVMIFAIGEQATQAGLAALTPTLYPSDRKAAGVGWAYGAGRVGSIVGPIIGSSLLLFDVDPSKIFLALSVFPLIGAFLMIWMLRMRRKAEAGRPSENRHEIGGAN